MKNSFNRLCGILVLLICALGLPSLLHAQDSADDLRATQIRSEISKRNGTGKYGEIASLLKELIGLGKRDSETYYKTALALALSDNRSQGRLYFDTAISRGWVASSDGGLANSLLGLTIDSATLIAIHSADSEAAAKALPRTSHDSTLSRLYFQDQAERMSLIRQGFLKIGMNGTTSFAMAMFENDASRRKQLMQLVTKSKDWAAIDYEHAALIMQHGDDTSCFSQAKHFALKAVELGDEAAKPIVAEAEDRYLITIGKPQKYGTQSHFDDSLKKNVLYPVDPNITDKERADWGVPPLKDALKKLDQLSR